MHAVESFLKSYPMLTKMVLLPIYFALWVIVNDTLAKLAAKYARKIPVIGPRLPGFFHLMALQPAARSEKQLIAELKQAADQAALDKTPVN
jgi:hypothetical protein